MGDDDNLVVTDRNPVARLKRCALGEPIAVQIRAVDASAVRYEPFAVDPDDLGVLS